MRIKSYNYKRIFSRACCQVLMFVLWVGFCRTASIYEKTLINHVIILS